MGKIKIGSLALGVFTAIGGFVDMGNLVTASQAGAQYRFALLWTVIVGTLGVIVYADLAGRVAIASGRALFDVIRERLGALIAPYEVAFYSSGAIEERWGGADISSSS